LSPIIVATSQSVTEKVVVDDLRSYCFGRHNFVPFLSEP
jgi:hypothetical protein